MANNTWIISDTSNIETNLLKVEATEGFSIKSQ